MRPLARPNMDCCAPALPSRRSSICTLGGRDAAPLPASAPLPKFVIHRGTLGHELRKQGGTSKFMILVPLSDLKFLNEFAAGGVGTSNRRHYASNSLAQSDRALERDLALQFP